MRLFIVTAMLWLATSSAAAQEKCTEKRSVTTEAYGGQQTQVETFEVPCRLPETGPLFETWQLVAAAVILVGMGWIMRREANKQ